MVQQLWGIIYLFIATSRLLFPLVNLSLKYYRVFNILSAILVWFPLTISFWLDAMFHYLDMSMSILPGVVLAPIVLILELSLNKEH
jgi:hypothetical protein